MLSKAQRQWIQHLNDSDNIDIFPYNPISISVFLEVQSKIKKVLGEVEVCHKGSSNLKISGQKEIDVYIPIDWRNFEGFSLNLAKIFGNPRSVYEHRRARFISSEDGVKIEIFIINRKSEDWLNLLKFEQALLENPVLLQEYEDVKNISRNSSTREYYTRKVEFINKVLAK